MWMPPGCYAVETAHHAHTCRFGAGLSMTLRWRISHSRTTSPSRCAAAPLEPGLAELWSLGGNASVHLLLRVLQHKYATYLPHTAGRYQTKRFRKATVRSTLCVVAGGGGTNCTGAAHWRCLLDLRCCRGVSDMGADVGRAF